MAEKPVDKAELERLGLYEPDDAHAAERLELIEYLLGLGATVEDLAEWRDELPIVASPVSLCPGPQQWTLAEARDRARPR